MSSSQLLLTPSFFGFETGNQFSISGRSHCQKLTTKKADRSTVPRQSPRRFGPIFLIIAVFFSQLHPPSSTFIHLPWLCLGRSMVFSRHVFHRWCITHHMFHPYHHLSFSWTMFETRRRCRHHQATSSCLALTDAAPPTKCISSCSTSASDLQIGRIKCDT